MLKMFLMQSKCRGEQSPIFAMQYSCKILENVLQYPWGQLENAKVHTGVPTGTELERETQQKTGG